MLSLGIVEERLAPLSPRSVQNWQDPTSSQALALQWLKTDVDASILYSDRQLAQKYALATFFYATNGSEWMTSDETSTSRQSFSSWLDLASSECEWFGVECNANEYVRVLRMDGVGLTGSLPSELDLLVDSLEEVYFNNNQLSSSIPTTIGLLTGLRRLQLSQNNLLGSLPPEVGTMRSLRLLSVKNNQLTGEIPIELGMMSTLVSLDLGRNRFVGNIPTQMGLMTSLQFLYFSGNNLSGPIPDELGNLASLRTVVFKENDFTGLVPLGLCGTEQLISDCFAEVACDCCTECCRDGQGCFDNIMLPTTSPSAPVSVGSPFPTSIATVPTTSEATIQPTDDENEESGMF